MTSRYSRLFLGLAISLGAAWAAEVNTSTSPANAAGNGAETIRTAQVWKATAAPKIVHGVVTVAEGASLTIEAGANIQFDGDLTAGIHVLGKLNVAGTAEKPVILQSVSGGSKDARWRGIWTDTKTAKVTITGTMISGAIAGVENRGGTARLSSVEIKDSVRAALAGGRSASLTVEDAKLTNNTFGIDAFDGATVSATGTLFKNNRTAVSGNATGLYLASNHFENNQLNVVSEDAGMVKGAANLLMTGGKFAEVEVAHLVTPSKATNVATVIAADTTWTTAQSPILVSSNLRVAAGATLTIQPGVTVRFAAGGGSGLNVDGSLVAVGTDAKPIYFTSSLDNGAKFTGAPGGFEDNRASAGDWDGIRLNSAAAKSTLEHVTVRYSRNGITAQGAGPVSLANNTFRDDVVGVAVAGSSASVTSSSDTFVNDAAGVQMAAGHAALSADAFSFSSVAISGAAGASASVAGSTVNTVTTPVAKQTGFALTMNGSNALAVAAPAVASLAPASIAPHADLRIGAQVACPLMPSFAGVPAGWSVDAADGRTAPNSFAATTGVQSRTNELQIGITNGGPLTVNGNSNGVYQGKQYTLGGCPAQVVVADLFIPSSWQQASNAPVATYLWAYATGGNTTYAVIGFRNYKSGQGQFSYWDYNAGQFVDLNPNSTAVNYNAWNNLSISYTGTAFVYSVNGVAVGTVTPTIASTALSTVSMYAVNFFDPAYTPTYGAAAAYTALWSDTQAPAITSTSIPTTNTGTLVSQQLFANEGAPPYTWTVGANLGGTTLSINASGVVSGTQGVAGTFTLPVALTDSQGNTANANLSFTAVTPAPPTAPNILSATPTAGVTGKAYSYGFTATGSGTLTWTVIAGTLPAGLTLNGNGTLSGTPTASAGTYNFTVQVSGSGGTSTAATSMVIYNPLTITTTGLPSGVKSQSYGPVTVAASGGSGSYTWSATGLPAGLSISGSGQISGNPTASGSSTAVVTATDSTAGTSASASFTVVITVQPLSITAPSLPSIVAVNGGVSGTFGASGGTPPYTFSSSGLPAGVTLSTAGVLGGAPTQPGAYSFNVQAGDSASASSSTTVTLGVLGFAPGFSLPVGTAGTQYSAQFSAPGISNVSFSSSSNLDGLSLSGSGALTGKPTAAGTFPISVTVTSGSISVTSAYTLSVGAAPVPLTLTGAALTPGQVLASYSSPVSVSGGTAPYTFSVIGGFLPSGLSISSAGVISGTPSAAGTSAFTLQVKDSAGATVSAPFTLQIAAQTLTIPTTTFPQGVVGIGYPSQVLSGAGGVAPYTFAITSGALPTGLTLVNGSITGTPSAAGTFTFTISITDSNTPATTVTSTQTIVINSNTSANLILGQSTLSFSINNGTTVASLPASESVTVTSSVALQLLSYTVSNSAAWLTVTPGSGTTVSTPGNPISVALNASALNLPSGTTSATIIVTCVAPSPCAGTAQNVTVNLTNTAPPPSLFLTTPLLLFTTTGTATPPSESFGLQNVGGGAITGITFSQADNWYTVSGVPSSPLPSGAPVQVTVSINPSTGLGAGYYTSSVTFTSSAGTATLQIGLQIVANQLSLSQSGGQFTMTAGGSPNQSSGSFQVGALASASWTASVLAGPSWLTLNTTSGTSAPASPGTVSFSINSNAASLAAGTYFGTIQIASTSVANSPLNFVVALTSTPVAVPVVPFPSPAGLVFLTNVGTNPSSQTVTVNVNSTVPITFAASANASWLSVPSTGTASAASPGSSSVSINTTGLAVGFYTGYVGYQTNGIGRSVNVYLVVLPAGVTFTSHAIQPGGVAPEATACTPTKLFAGQTGLVNNFQQSTGLPTPLSVIVVNDCGAFVSTASVNVTFSDGDTPIQLSASAQLTSAGIYSGTWTPANASPQVSVIATASSPGLTSASAQVTGQVGSSGLPILTKGSTTNVYSATIGGGIAPGSIVELFGSNLAPSPAQATSFPLPTTLNGISVTIGGTAAPLYYVGPTQVNAQLPSGLLPGNQYQVVVSDAGAVASPDTIQIVPVSPGVGATVSGVALAQHASTFATITEASPAKPGEFVTLYLSGLGATSVPVAAGTPSPSNPPATASTQPTLTLNGTSIPITFAGLTPTLAGLFQINFQLPANTPNGDLQLVVTQSGVSSLPVILPVHN